MILDQISPSVHFINVETAGSLEKRMKLGCIGKTEKGARSETQMSQLCPGCIGAYLGGNNLQEWQATVLGEQETFLQRPDDLL